MDRVERTKKIFRLGSSRVNENVPLRPANLSTARFVGSATAMDVHDESESCQLSLRKLGSPSGTRTYDPSVSRNSIGKYWQWSTASGHVSSCSKMSDRSGSAFFEGIV